MHLWRQHIDDHQFEETHELSPKSMETSTVLLSNIHEGSQLQNTVKKVLLQLII